MDVTPFTKVRVLRAPYGAIAWRLGTGGNIEILHLKCDRGRGRELMAEAVRRMDPPYATVFGFTRVCNFAAIRFYEKLGFAMSRVKGVYADGEAMVFSANYEELKEKLCER